MNSSSLPFQMRLAHFAYPQQPCELPFVIGGATQHRGEATVESRNSQDCIGILIGPRALVAVVCDGCTGTHPDIEASSYSSNDVGAKLLTYTISQHAFRLAQRYPRMLPSQFVERLSRVGLRKIESVQRMFSGRDKNVRARFASDFLMSTVLGLAVTRTQYIVFHSGDGIIVVNGDIHSLDSEAGVYLGNDLVNDFGQEKLGDNSLKLHTSGPVEELNSIFLATDGLSRIASTYSRQLLEFITSQPSNQQTENGLDFLLQEFRQKVAWNSDVTFRSDDDASFALVRRVQGRLE